jgi:hypothetical protein
MKPELYGISIVLLGNFNPKIFQPAWFASQNLIRKIEAEKAKIEIIHSDITIFNLEWLKIEVTRERVNIATEQEPYFEALVDFVIGAFRILKHTPISKMGINSTLHYSVKSIDAWHKIGHRLAPKEPWKGILNKPGMLRVEMEDERLSGPKGFTRVRVEPSRLIDPGIFVNVNDHFESAEVEPTSGSEAIIDILEENWLSSIKKSKSIAEKICR